VPQSSEQPAWSLEVFYGCDNLSERPQKRKGTPPTSATGTIPPAKSQRPASQPGRRLLAGSCTDSRWCHHRVIFESTLFLSDKGHSPEGWVYKSEAEMGKETGLTKREQQTARRKLLSLGVIAIMRGGWKNTYHFKVIWERLYQVIAGSQQTLPTGRQAQNVPTEKVERAQTVPAEPVQNVATQPPECLQNVTTRWKQNVATHYKENNTEKKETEKKDRENQETWDKALELLKQDLPVREAEVRLTGTALVEVTDTKALIFVPNRFAIPWLERRLYRQIAKAMKGVVGKDLDLQFVACS
jgi:hypothetical protein